MTKEFKIANISMRDGHLEIDGNRSSRLNRHRNVIIELDEKSNRIKVTGEKVFFGVGFNKGEFDLDEITEDSTELYKPWPWSSPKRRSLNWVEYLKTEKRTYTSNNWVIIE